METPLAAVPLKEMDPAALAMALISHAESAPGVDADAVRRAVDAAAYLHLGQWRANRLGFDRTHYIEHPLRNALRALRWGVERTPLIVGIVLHDTVEDCLERILHAYAPGTPDWVHPAVRREVAYSWIEEEFGPDASALVRSLTNPLPTGAALSVEQKRVQYAEHVAASIRGDADAFVGKFADFMDNAGGLHHNLVPGNEAMIRKLAAKYRPVVGVFAGELEDNGHAVRALLSESGYAEVQAKIADLPSRLDRLALQAAA